MNSIKFAVRQGARPVSGTRLFSYSHAWLSASGLAAGGSIPVSVAKKIAGQSMISYHTGKTGCLEIRGNELFLTQAGQEKFGTKGRAGGVGPQKIDPAMIAEYVAFMTTGKQGGSLKVNPDCIEKIG